MPDAQGTNALAKADTVLLCTTAGTLTVDQSQYGDDLVADTTAVYETSSSLRALDGDGGRELYVRVDLSGADKTKVLLIHADPADLASHTYLIRTDGTYQIIFSQDNTTIATLPTGLAGALDLSIHWATRPNPDTTGASDALISEFALYSHTAGAFLGEFAQATHAVASTSSSWALTIGGWWDGASATLTSGQVSKCRIGRAFHPLAELAEDWIAARSAHSTAYLELLEPVPITVASGLADESEWTGQANAGYLAAQADQTRGRALTDLVNEHYSDARTLTNTPSPTQWLAGPPGGSTKYKLDVTMLRWVPHPGPTRAWVRVQVQSWVTAGAAVPVGLRVYAFNRPHLGVGPTLEGSPTPALDFDFVETTLTIDHGSGGVGEWLELGLLRLPRFDGGAPSWAGTLVLGLAHAFDPGNVSAKDANARLKIKGWQVRPVLGVD